LSFQGHDITSRPGGGKDKSIVQPAGSGARGDCRAVEGGKGGIIRRRMSRSSARTEAFAETDRPRSAAPCLREARAFCARLAREHYENFPVASWLLPARVRDRKSTRLNSS